MKGKIAFVLGAAVGYVLGTRAGRERYEQIKRGAETVWNTEPVQRGVTLVRDALDDKADDVKAFVRRASSDVFANLAKQTSDSGKTSASKSASAQASGAKNASSKTSSSKSSSAKTATAKKSAAKSNTNDDQPADTAKDKS